MSGGCCPGGCCPGGCCPGGYCPGGYCPGGYCPRTLATQPRGVCQNEGYIPLGGLDKTLVVHDVLNLEVSIPLFDRKSTENGSFSC